MNLDGERIDGHIRILRALITRDGITLDEALDAAGSLVPPADHEAVRQAYERQSSTTIKVLRPDVLSEGGPRPWFANFDPSSGYYWRRQRNFLAHDLGREDFEIDDLDRASNDVLEHLEDPHLETGFAIRGLVIGHVQSGKTQNFSALIAKAADAGYKIVIVLSGLHNTLRQQTQRRLERDLGRENVAGVGEPEAGKRWQWMTGSEVWGDFDPGAVNAALLQGNENVIFVVKKNKTRLERLIEWMDGRVPDHVPVLVIDDEADQASINTGGNRNFEAREEVDLVGDSDFDGDNLDDDELDPSTINLNIRLLLRSFVRCSYVAYTATPFANVLIDPSAYDVQGGNDLFPRNFIISLPTPPGGLYVGATQLFGRDRLPADAQTSADEDGLNVIEFVPDHEVEMLVPPPRQRAGFVPIAPPTLKQALVDYVLASAAWLQRSGKDEPCTMLIHTDMRRAMQDPLGPEVRAELAYIRQRWLYESSEYRPLLKARWDDRFRPLTISINLDLDRLFDVIEPYIDRLLRDGIDVRILNSNWSDTVDFDHEPTLKAVLIGGNKLSRGLTIEGLLVSYYVRETLYYDTLMQMGRWFGYRGRFVDLTRIYSTEQLVTCFHDLATAEEELRRQISRYKRDRLTPTRFVPKVRTHPLMQITSESKMQAAVRVNLNFAGERVQTLRFPEKPTDALLANLDVTRQLLSSLGQADGQSDAKPSWSAVSPDVVKRFLYDFRVMNQFAIDPPSVVEYIDNQLHHGELMRWRVLLSSAIRQRDEAGWTEDLGVYGMPRVPLISRSRLANDPTSLGVVTDPGDELIGLSDQQIIDADREFEDGHYGSRAEAYRSRRDPVEGLLMLYPISAFSSPGANASSNRVRLFADPSRAQTLIAYAVSFPFSSTDATREYVSAPRPQGTL
ncbi:Z1 domain-containing protein [Mycolicibacterium sp. Y3]